MSSASIFHQSSKIIRSVMAKARASFRCRGHHHTDSLSQQGIQMSQTFLHAVCLQAPYAPVPQDSIIQSFCGITEVRAAFAHDIR